MVQHERKEIRFDNLSNARQALIRRKFDDGSLSAEDFDGCSVTVVTEYDEVSPEQGWVKYSDQPQSVTIHVRGHHDLPIAP